MSIKNLSLSLLVASLAFVLSTPAKAMVEIRGGYGMEAPSEEFAGNDDTLTGLTLDVMVSPPVFGAFSLGLRYESNSKEILGVDIDHNRTSLQLAYTAIDLEILEIDIVGGFGLAEEIKAGPIKVDDGQTTNIGLLGRVGLGLISLNAELGYQFGKLSTTGVEVEMDGTYAKFLVGVGF
jgi:hypothetical protein